MKKYKISVIIPIYNVKKYLEDAINSIINQTIGFKNIQLILVNDGSPFNEEEICKKYEKKYDNIIYIYQENKGVSVARNVGLRYATGKYINFLDPDDKLEKNAFEIGYTMLEKHPDINFVSYRQKFFEAQKGYHILDYKFTEGDKIVDIKKEYDYLQLSAASSLIRKSAINGIFFDQDIKISEDAKFMTEILFKNKNTKYGIISTSNYMYRRRKVKNSKIQTQNSDISNYSEASKKVYEYVFDLSKKQFGEIIPYAQYFVMYHLNYKIITGIKMALDEKEVKLHKEYIIKLLKNINDYIILEQKNIDILTKIYILNIKYNKDIQDNLIIKNSNLFFKNIPFQKIDNSLITLLKIKEIDNKLIYSISIPKFILNDLKILINGKETKKKIIEKIYNNFDLFDNIPLKEYILEIELTKNKKNIIEFILYNKPIYMNSIDYLKQLNNTFFQYKTKNYYTKFKNNKIIIEKKNIKSIIFQILFYIRLIILNNKSFILSLLLTITKIIYKNIELIFISDSNEKEIMDYFRKKDSNMNNYIVIKNNKFKNNLKFKLKYLNAKNIYYDINDNYNNPVGNSYSLYINKINTTYNIFIYKNTKQSLIEKEKLKYKKTRFIELK